MSNQKNLDPQNAEMTEALEQLIDASKNIADVLMCAYRTMQREMLDRGAPRVLADEAALEHARRLLGQMMGQGGEVSE